MLIHHEPILFIWIHFKRINISCINFSCCCSWLTLDGLVIGLHPLWCHFLPLTIYRFICLIIESGPTLQLKTVSWFPFPVPPPGEEDLGRHPDHPAGHDGVGRLWRLSELRTQSVLWVGEVQRVRRLLKQAESGQETSQSAGDGALLLQCKNTSHGGGGCGPRMHVYTYDHMWHHESRNRYDLHLQKVFTVSFLPPARV